MDIEAASHRLHDLIAPSGPSFRPGWFGTLGVGRHEGEDALFLYAYDPKAAKKFLADHTDVFGRFESFPVVVREWEGIAPLGGT